jgi:hypothetical protein
VIISESMRSIATRGRRLLSQRPHLISRASVYATDCGLTPLARYSSIYESSKRSHLLIAVLLNVSAGELALACRNVIDINNMTSNMISLEAAMRP